MAVERQLDALSESVPSDDVLESAWVRSFSTSSPLMSYNPSTGVVVGITGSTRETPALSAQDHVVFRRLGTALGSVADLYDTPARRPSEAGVGTANGDAQRFRYRARTGENFVGSGAEQLLPGMVSRAELVEHQRSVMQFRAEVNKTMRDMQAQIRDITDAVNLSAVSVKTASQHAGKALTVISEDLDGEAAAEAINDVLDAGVALPSSFQGRLVEWLGSQTADLRAAAARAMATIKPELALELLPAALNDEPDPLTRAVIRGALRAAKA